MNPYPTFFLPGARRLGFRGPKCSCGRSSSGRSGATFGVSASRGDRGDRLGGRQRGAIQKCSASVQTIYLYLYIYIEIGIKLDYLSIYLSMCTNIILNIHIFFDSPYNLRHYSNHILLN